MKNWPRHHCDKLYVWKYHGGEIWPGWGSGILGDCGSLDPGSIPGPGPTNLDHYPSVNFAPQLGHSLSPSDTGFPQAGHSYSVRSGPWACETSFSGPSRTTEEFSSTDSANTENSVPHAPHLVLFKDTNSPQKGHSKRIFSKDAPHLGQLFSIPETVFPHETHAKMNTGAGDSVIYTSLNCRYIIRCQTTCFLTKRRTDRFIFSSI